MNISEALHAAADDIEQNPGGYRFMNALVPTCGEAGCMLGKLGKLAGARPLTTVNEVAARLLGIYPETFYERVDKSFKPLLRINTGNMSCFSFNVHDPAMAAAGMRKLAGKYKLIPDDIRAIFADNRGLQINQEFHNHEHV
jgi:hypothetical protein